LVCSLHNGRSPPKGGVDGRSETEKARRQEAGDRRLEWQVLVILRNEMTKNLVLTRISAGRQRARNVRLLAGSASSRWSSE
jgi:hypothetical protein